MGLTKTLNTRRLHLLYNVNEGIKMAYITIATRVPKKIHEILTKIMKEERLDKSTTTRKMLELGIDEWKKEKAIDQLKKGKVTLSKAAEIAGLSIYEMIELVKDEKIDYIHISAKELDEEAKMAEGE